MSGAGCPVSCAAVLIRAHLFGTFEMNPFLFFYYEQILGRITVLSWVAWSACELAFSFWDFFFVCEAAKQVELCVGLLPRAVLHTKAFCKPSLKPKQVVSKHPTFDFRIVNRKLRC
jgi:hypothetical protein